MDTFWSNLESFLTGKCLYYKNCRLYRKDSFYCNKEIGEHCGASRNFDELGKRSKNYEETKGNL
jgi:hypothetical protein